MTQVLYTNLAFFMLDYSNCRRIKLEVSKKTIHARISDMYINRESMRDVTIFNDNLRLMHAHMQFAYNELHFGVKK